MGDEWQYVIVNVEVEKCKMNHEEVTIEPSLPALLAHA